MRKGILVFSPISHSHSIAKIGDLPKDWQYWGDFCRATLSICDTMYVLMLDGWEESAGVKAEIGLAKELGLQIEYLRPKEFGIGHEKEIII
jgi:hypothetical protein